MITMDTPLAILLRSTTITNIIGQSHLLNNNGIINRILNQKFLTSLIFYGNQESAKLLLLKR